MNKYDRIESTRGCLQRYSLLSIVRVSNLNKSKEWIATLEACCEERSDEAISTRPIQSAMRSPRSLRLLVMASGHFLDDRAEITMLFFCLQGFSVPGVGGCPESAKVKKFTALESIFIFLDPPSNLKLLIINKLNKMELGTKHACHIAQSINI
jgi:hypothetical protein